jgi:hypothetical protein
MDGTEISKKTQNHKKYRNWILSNCFFRVFFDFGITKVFNSKQFDINFHQLYFEI